MKILFLLLFFPIILLLGLILSVLKITGRLIMIILGGVFTIVGIIVSLTIIGAIIGIPLLLIGIGMIIIGFS